MNSNTAVYASRSLRLKTVLCYMSLFCIMQMAIKNVKFNGRDLLSGMGSATLIFVDVNTTASQNRSNKIPKIDPPISKSNPPLEFMSTHIYWIDDSQADNPESNETSLANRNRTRMMEDQFQSLGILKQHVTRIPIWTVTQVKDAIDKGKFLIDKKKVQLIDKNSSRQELEPLQSLGGRSNRQYTFVDAALLLSHLATILQAHSDEKHYDNVLILQSNAILTREFLQHGRASINLAPTDWGILQWTTSNLPSLEQGLLLAGHQDYWRSWLPDMLGIHAYQINRQGMEAVLETFLSEFGKAWVFPERMSRRFLPEESIFLAAGSVYTSSVPWILSSDLSSSMDPELATRVHETQQQQQQQQQQITKTILKVQECTRNETFLGFMNVRFESLRNLRTELEKVRDDVMSVCNNHCHNCQWIINAVKAKRNLDRPMIITNTTLTFDQAVQAVDFPSYVAFEVTFEYGRFNKFAFLSKHLDKLDQYDLILIKDADQRLVGFPWLSFLEQKGNALLAGPLRQVPAHVFADQSKTQVYYLHDAAYWKATTTPIQTIWNHLFANGIALSVPFIEMYFNVFDGPFAKWLFPQLLTPTFVASDVSWGPDYLWCPAALEYNTNHHGHGINNNTRTPCALVPFVSVHEDTRQLHKDSTFTKNGFAALKAFKSSEPTSRWFNQSKPYTRRGAWMKKPMEIVQECSSTLQKQQRQQYHSVEENHTMAEEGNIHDITRLDIQACIDSYWIPKEN